MAERRSVAVWAVCAAALAVSIAAFWTSVATIDRLKAQSRIEMALSLQRQFDDDFKEDRADCARAFLYSDKKKKGLEGSPYPYVMDFFDTVGYLVERQAVDEPMAKRLFAYHLDHYLEAARKLLQEERQETPKRYEHLFKLAARWEEKGPPLDLTHFFQHELEFGEPVPADGGPRL